METADQPAKKLKVEGSGVKFAWKPRPILADELTQQPNLQKSFIGILKNKKHISKSIAGLAGCLPCPQFLKRCSGLKIYLAPVDNTNKTTDDIKNYLIKKGFDVSLLENDLEIADVPSVASKTKAQMVYASRFWPVNFHPDLNLEALISGSLFNDVQLASLEICMRAVISAASDSTIGSSECNGTAAIIDPENGKILSLAASSVDVHPMWHASMLAVDLVARIQGGGAWELVKSLDNEINPAKRKLTCETPLRYPDSLSRIEIPEDGSLSFANEERKKKKCAKEGSKEKCGPYLCTGYWAVLLQEPCPLCAMALLHSRVSRIFYGAANPRTGILGSRAALHSVPGVNHRYQVWSGVLEDECTEAIKKCRRID